MAAKRMRWTALIIALLIVPGEVAAQEGIIVTDFTGTVNHPLTATVKLRRGRLSTIRIVKHQIDLVLNTFIDCDCPSIVSAFVRGRTSQGIGFLEVKLSVPEDRTIGAVESIAAGGSRFQFRIVHKGQLNSVNLVPDPKNIGPGQPFEVTVNGVDLGTGANVSQLSCHTITVLSRVNTSFRVRLTKTGCGSPLGPFSFAIRSVASGDPDVYTTSQGKSSFQFGPYAGCLAEPALGAPVVITPSHNQVFSFLPKAPRIITIQFRWHRATSNNLNAPGNEWLVELPERDLSTGTTSQILPPQVKTVADTTISEPFRRPGEYHVAIRAKNCGTLALSRTIRFVLR